MSPEAFVISILVGTKETKRNVSAQSRVCIHLDATSHVVGFSRLHDTGSAGGESVAKGLCFFFCPAQRCDSPVVTVSLDSSLTSRPAA